MVTVEKVSPTGATITVTFMVMMTAAINLDVYGEILKTHIQLL